MKLKSLFSLRKWIEFYLNKTNGKSLSDESFVKLRFYAAMGKKLDLDDPKTFNEKLQWLKLYNRKPEYTMMVDKYLVRDYIKEKLGEEYLIPLLGAWDDPDEIDFDALPDRFVLKCNHNSGTGMYICRDKSKMDVQKVKDGLRRGLAEDFFMRSREWPYKNVPRKIICEQYMEQKGSSDLTDYKFYCFNGEPKLLYVSIGLSNHDTAQIGYVDMDWKKLPVKRTDYADLTEMPSKPINFDKMVQFARALSKDIPFLRVDFYEINGKIYFGELTFFPGSGLTVLEPKEWDETFGKWLNIAKTSAEKA